MPRKPAIAHRRRFITLAVAGLAGGALLPVTVRAEEKVAEDDPTAQALAYVEDATQSDKRPDATQVCRNCQLYTGADGEQWGPCLIFQNKLVNADGWCSAWVLMAA